MRTYEFSTHAERLEHAKGESEISSELEHRAAGLLLPDEAANFLNERDGLSWINNALEKLQQVALRCRRRDCGKGLVRVATGYAST